MKQWTLLAVLAAVTCVSCTSGGMRNAPAQWAHLAELSYPADEPRGEDLDIVLVRHGGVIELVNRTPHSYDNVQLWINEQWVGTIDRIEIGTGNRFSLNQFVDRHRRSFPIAGLLTPDQTRRLVHAELYNPETRQRHRLTVQLERRPL